MSYDLYDRVLGCLLAAGMGDGIGAPTEGLSQDEIAAEYGKAVETFEDGSQNFYSLGNDVAEVTDDASQMYEMAKEIVSCGGPRRVPWCAGRRATPNTIRVTPVPRPRS